MYHLRVLLFYFLISLITIIFYILFFIPLSSNIKYHWKYKIAKLFSYVFIFLTKYICGLNYEIIGMDKLPKVPSLVLANHQSFWDNVIMQLIIPEHSWIIKKELYQLPVLGSALRMLNPIAVERSHNSSVKQILKEGSEKFKNKLWLIMFPESTRLKPEETVKFKTSAAKLALMNKVPIVLIAHNAGVYWPKGFWFRRPGKIMLKITRVLYPEEIENKLVKDLTEEIEQIINTEKQYLFDQTI